ncbi:Hpr1p NDAI_0J01090 [Naumovozyma dairenensis CBS 421]|uniref:THO complex subunit HPR1 n=1 Tax=Naumovozyma dairenensis (strain ATCC 10597 / BCRC 20456 / CBS 421 / NBRC 0211 / NRRL Y-12639) TaxID=1071378 RepID=G0WGS3_NAUDC|nr:hypothetical protein NDAI_0J01090 [Naumovozyma dairenensis CBS 421]CCD27001.1 hypothetical protein NDAI_0J01090 [Naumovozyma dairenensis CBS 421]
MSTGKLESVIHNCASFLVPQLTAISNDVRTTILTKPLESTTFNDQLLTFKWDDSISQFEKNQDNIISLVLKRIIIENLSTPLDHDHVPNDEFEGEGYTTDDIVERKLALCATILDFCYHSRKNMKIISSWLSIYFDLFTMVTDLLTWPKEILKFWTYAKLALIEFKANNNDDNDYKGLSNLISYKAPLSEKLRHWNELINLLDRNENFNTPLHFKMKYKLEKFVSELLPIYEESNFNRSLIISQDQLKSGSSWNKIDISGKNRTLNSRNEMFFNDYLYVVENLITNPLGTIFASYDDKLDLEQTMNPVIDALFDLEDAFYRKTKTHQKKLKHLENKLNSNYQADFSLTKSKQPRYMELSKTLTEGKENYWKAFMGIQSTNSDLLPPNLLEISTTNPETLYSQMMAPNNDFFRKQFILQLVFVLSFMKKLLLSDELKTIYKNAFRKDRSDDLVKEIDKIKIDDKKYQKIILLSDRIIKTRIIHFYSLRDPSFENIIIKLMESDLNYLDAKADNFKNFQKFEISDEKIPNEFTFNYSFKKFGFVKLGNKSINNVWKINSGLDNVNIEGQTINHSNGLYANLKEKWFTDITNGNSENQPKDEDNEIVKRWQILRSLRSQYLFEFNKVNEDIGIKGLFNKDLVDEWDTKTTKPRLLFKDEILKDHQEKLNIAREYMKNHEKKKRPLEEDTTFDENSLPKKSKLVNPLTNEEKGSTDVEEIKPIVNKEEEKEENEENENEQIIIEESPITESKVTDTNNDEPSETKQEDDNNNNNNNEVIEIPEEQVASDHENANDVIDLEY